MTKATKSGIFFEDLLTHIMHGVNTPKFQVERAIGPILGFFLPKAISELLNSERHAHRKGRIPSNVVTLAAEFPLKKPEPSKQSTNIDWLMYDTANKELLLVELKTEFASFQGGQLDRYLQLAATASPWTGMKAGFDEICNVTKSPKYGCAKKQLDILLKNYPDVEKARVRVVYLAPKATAASFTEAVKDFKQRNPELVLGDDSAVCFSFDDLAHDSTRKENGDFSGYRDMLFEALRQLDVDDKALMETGTKNYRGLSTLDDMLKKCRKDASILVGFLGGSKALAQQDSAHLEKRLYKWDKAGDESVGRKNQINWIEAEQFIKIVQPILSSPLRSEADLERIVLGVGNALRNNPKLTLGQIIEQASSNAPIPLEDLSDDDLVKAFDGLAAAKHPH